MRITVQRLRTGIILLSIALVAAIAIFLAYARYERRHLVRDLPARLGVKIQESADSFTLSKSDKGHTKFTIHASKALQYKGGHVALHDVSIMLYGAHDDRADHIYGTDFDYDSKSGVATASGEVEIDLQAPAGAAPVEGATSAKASGDASQNEPEKSTVHVKTNGLVFNRDSGTATTQGFVEFRMAQGAGHATGASFDSKAGVLVLDSAVEMDSSRNGNAFTLKAAHAQILRDTRQVFLLNPVADYQNERTSADEAIVYFRPDGSAEHVDARGHVDTIGDGGQELKSPTAKILFDAHNQPQHADLSGGVFFVANDNVHHMHGDAVQAAIQFGEASSLRHLQLQNAVSFVDQQIVLPDDPKGSSTREVRAAQIDVDFVSATELSGATRRSAAQQVLATGGATVVLHTISSKHPQQNTTIGADKLVATLLNGNAIDALTGTGHTRIVDVAADGATQTSSGDNLVIGFMPLNAAQRKPKGANQPTLPATQIQTAVQQGNVAITQTAASGSKDPAAPMHITAQRAEYRSAGEVLHLDGSPRFNDGSLDLSSDTMEFQRLSGVATATGNVKATYLQAPGQPGVTATAAGHGSLALGAQGPAHIVTDSADMNRGPASPASEKSAGVNGAKAAPAGDAIFRGHARLWQGTNSISAPVIELSRAKQSLKAHGDGSGTAGASDRVDTTLAGASTARRAASVDHIQSRELTYVEGDRQATFSGGVVAQSADGTIHCDQAIAYLIPSASSSGPPPSTNGEMPSSTQANAPGQSQIDRIVAVGHIVLDQPGRSATGDKLIYTAQDGNFTLTGAGPTQPRIVDQIHGTVTGASLIFNSRDDSVRVSGGQSRASTDTHAGK